jgi:hypothetical protein
VSELHPAQPAVIAAPATSQPITLKFDERKRVATNVPVREVKTRRYQILGLVYS